MIKQWIALVMLISFSVCGTARAADGGRALLAQCQGVLPYLYGDESKGGTSVAEGMCVGLVEGVLKTMQAMNPHMQKGFQTCFPQKPVTIGEAVQAVVDYLQTTELKDTDDATLALFALQDAYPCK